MNRREFLRSAGFLALGAGGLPPFLSRAALGLAPGGKKTLVVIFQRGACDGLSLLPPVGDPRYLEYRPNLAIRQPLALDGVFGLHPALSGLKPWWDEGRLAFLHQVGSSDPTRSHFDAQDFMESGTPGRKGTADGYLNRAVRELGSGQSAFGAVALSPTLPRSLWGSGRVLAAGSLQGLGGGGLADPRTAGGFEALYAGALDEALRGAGREAFGALKTAREIRRGPGMTDVEYPKSDLGRRLRDIATLIKNDTGVRIAATECGNWDTHAGQGADDGKLAKNFRDVGDSIAAFAKDLGARLDDVVVVMMTEFGRTVKENGNRGTDHGHGSVMTILGGDVHGKRVIARGWNGVAERGLFEGRDLPVTTDYRAPLAEVMHRPLGVASLKNVFPGFSPPRESLGLFRG